MTPKRAQLYLNDALVGDVVIEGRGHSWSYGRFQPHPNFSAFAMLFGRWSMLMHEENDGRLGPAASDELRQTECEIDRLNARLFIVDDQKWVKCAQLNIDSEMIEWKEY
jgi:hypothetical protein